MYCFLERFGFGLCFVNEQRCDVEVQRLCQGFQLCDGWFKGSVLQLTDHGAVDTRQVCKLDLRQALFLSTGFYGFGQTVEGKLLLENVLSNDRINSILRRTGKQLHILFENLITEIE